MRVVAEAGQREDVLAVALRERPDVVVLDFNVAGVEPIGDLCRDLCHRLPECAVLLVLDQPGCSAIGAALADLVPRIGLIAVDASAVRLLDGIRKLVAGEPVVDVELAIAALTARANPLTTRERDVLRRAASGVPPTEIAAELFLSTGTVRNYLSRIVAKTGGRTRIEAFRIAQDAGWI